MFILDSLFVGGLRFVIEKIADVAEREMHDRKQSSQYASARSSRGCVNCTPIAVASCCPLRIWKASTSKRTSATLPTED